MFIDSITMVFEEASSRGPPLSVPVTCSESGNGYSLPNLALRFSSSSRSLFNFVHRHVEEFLI